MCFTLSMLKPLVQTGQRRLRAACVLRMQCVQKVCPQVMTAASLGRSWHTLQRSILRKAASSCSAASLAPPCASRSSRPLAACARDPAVSARVPACRNRSACTCFACACALQPLLQGCRRRATPSHALSKRQCPLLVCKASTRWGRRGAHAQVLLQALALVLLARGALCVLCVLPRALGRRAAGLRRAGLRRARGLRRGRRLALAGLRSNSLGRDALAQARDLLAGRLARRLSPQLACIARVLTRFL